MRVSAIRRPLWLVASFLVVYALAVIFPQPLFANKIEYKNFSVYSHQRVGSTIYPLLDRVENKLSRSGLRTSKRIHKIFLCSSAAEFAFFAPHRHRATSLNYQLGHNIFVASADVPQNHAGYPRRYGSTLTWILTHEIVHTLEQDTIGLRAALKLPFWKREGYAEYIAEESGIELRQAVHLLDGNDSPIIIISEKIAIPRQYFEARLLVEYYLQTKKASFEQLVNDEIDINELRNEMSRWAGQ